MVPLVSFLLSIGYHLVDSISCLVQFHSFSEDGFKLLQFL
jgi:hypothetical protein